MTLKQFVLGTLFAGMSLLGFSQDYKDVESFKNWFSNNIESVDTPLTFEREFTESQALQLANEFLKTMHADVEVKEIVDYSNTYEVLPVKLNSGLKEYGTTLSEYTVEFFNALRIGQDGIALRVPVEGSELAITANGKYVFYLVDTYMQYKEVTFISNQLDTIRVRSAEKGQSGHISRDVNFSMTKDAIYINKSKIEPLFLLTNNWSDFYTGLVSQLLHLGLYRKTNDYLEEYLNEARNSLGNLEQVNTTYITQAMTEMKNLEETLVHISVDAYVRENFGIGQNELYGELKTYSDRDMYFERIIEEQSIHDLIKLYVTGDLHKLSVKHSGN